MGYAVHYRDASGSPQLDGSESLESALARVEQLRNEDGATDVRVFREVPIEIRTYYKVVAVEDEEASSRSQPPPGAMPLTPPPVKVSAVASEGADPTDGDRPDEPEPASDGARRASLFNRG